MSVSGAAAIATTVFSYFSPTKSPFYTVIAFGAVALILSIEINADYSLLIFIPICVVLLVTTFLSFRSTSDITATEYNNQIKFCP